MNAEVIGIVELTPTGELRLPAAVKDRLRALLARRPGADAFQVREQDGALVLEPASSVRPPTYELSPEEVDALVSRVRERGMAYETSSASPDDEFIGDLSSREYFALTDQEQERLWDELAADAPGLEDWDVIEVKPDARVPARQERYP